MLNKSIIWLVISVCSITAFAQQNAQFTQYLDNMLYYNPGYTGSRGNMNVSGMHRQQWVGFKGAPMSQSIAIHSPIKSESASIGLSILNDKAGPVNQTWINASAAYAFRFKRNDAKLSIGISGGVDILNGDLTTLYAVDQNDPMAQNYSNSIKPNAGFGVYYHSNTWFMGLSIPQIVERGSASTELNFNVQRHYYFAVGGYITLNRMLKLRPSTLVKISENAPLIFDASVALMFYDKFWIGGNYRISESAGGFFQYQFSNQFKLGYAFDVSTSRLIRHNFGTHEILLSYDFVFKNKFISSPRYF